MGNGEDDESDDADTDTEDDESDIFEDDDDNGELSRDEGAEEEVLE